LSIQVASPTLDAHSEDKIWGSYLHSENYRVSKEGLPHAHIVIKVCLCVDHTEILMTLTCQLRYDIPLDEINDIIKAELPHNNPMLREKVKKFMSHGEDHLS
jgi:hypothetical protein